MTTTTKVTIAGLRARMTIRLEAGGAVRLDYGPLGEPDKRYCTVEVQLARPGGVVDLDLEDAEVAAAALLDAEPTIGRNPWGWCPDMLRTWHADVLVQTSRPRVVVRTTFTWRRGVYRHPREWFASWANPAVPNAVAHSLVWRHAARLRHTA